MNKTITLEELVIEMMPFSDELATWCKAHPEFLTALKNIHAGKFISLGAIVTSYPSGSFDEVIGVYTYDYKSKTPKFKQDFIINKNRENKEFVLYTRSPAGSSIFVKDIKVFFATYGVNGNYTNSHHLTYDELPSEIKPRAIDAINLAARLIELGGFQKPSQGIVESIYADIKNIKKQDRYIKQKMKRF